MFIRQIDADADLCCIDNEQARRVRPHTSGTSTFHIGTQHAFEHREISTLVKHGQEWGMRHGAVFVACTFEHP